MWNALQGASVVRVWNRTAYISRGRSIDRSLDIVDHIAVQVDDIAAAIAWYTDNFECRIAYQDDTWAMLEFANTKMALVLPGQHPGHVAFQKDSLDKFGEVKVHRDGMRYVYFEDPFGNTVEVVGKR